MSSPEKNRKFKNTKKRIVEPLMTAMRFFYKNQINSDIFILRLPL